MDSSGDEALRQWRDAMRRELDTVPSQMESWSDEQLESYRQGCESQLKEFPSYKPAKLFLELVLQVIASRKMNR
jgi:hypothetical protein